MKMLFFKKFILSFLVLCVKSEKPHCSKYDFEEKVLEKLVRMEFQMQRMKTEMDESAKTVKDTVLEVGATLGAVDQKFKEVKEEVETNISNTMKTMQHGLEQYIKDKIEAIEKKTSEKISAKLNELQSLKDQTVTPTIAFKARLDADLNPTVGTAIMFPVVLFNDGDAYTKETGKFTASMNGTYLFSVAFCLYNKKYINVGIMVDGVKYTATTLYGDTNHSCYTADTVAVLKNGQTVWVQSLSTLSGSIIAHYSSKRWNTFSGTIIHI